MEISRALRFYLCTKYRKNKKIYNNVYKIDVMTLRIEKKRVLDSVIGISCIKFMIQDMEIQMGGYRYEKKSSITYLGRVIDDKFC